MKRFERRHRSSHDIRAIPADSGDGTETVEMVVSAVSRSTDPYHAKTEKQFVKTVGWLVVVALPILLIIAIAWDDTDPSQAKKYAIQTYPLVWCGYGLTLLSAAVLLAVKKQWRRLVRAVLVAVLSLLIAINVPVILYKVGPLFPFGVNISSGSYYAWRYVDFRIEESNAEQATVTITNRGLQAISNLSIGPVSPKKQPLNALKDSDGWLKSVRIGSNEIVQGTLDCMGPLGSNAYYVTSVDLVP